MALPVVLGLVCVVGMLLANLSEITGQQARQARTHSADAEHLYRAEAVLHQVLNRLKQRAWEVRYYADGPPSRGPYQAHQSGTYREGTYELWVQDVPAPGTRAIPGLVDLFLEMRYLGVRRLFHARVHLKSDSSRRQSSVETVYFGRTPHAISQAEGRSRAQEEATEAMRAEDAAAPTRFSLDPLLERGSETIPDPRDFAESLLKKPLEAASWQEARTRLRKGIHLLGEDGRGLQGLLPPLERQRFVRRRADLEAAREEFRAAKESFRNLDPSAFLEAALAESRSLSVAARRRGPASTFGQDAQVEAASILKDAVGVLDSLGESGRGQLDPTLVASVLLEAAKVAIRGSKGRVPSEDWAELEAMALTKLEAWIPGGKIYGGTEWVEQVLARWLEPLESPAENLRSLSDEPLPTSGWAPVTEAEVDAFLVDPGSGWDGFDEDHGASQDQLDQLWEERFAREGEGGSNAPAPFFDADGDGLPDPVPLPGGNDRDRDRVPDGSPFEASILVCVQSRCAAGLRGAIPECARDCQGLIQRVRDLGAELEPGSIEVTDDGPRTVENPILDSYLEDLGGAPSLSPSGEVVVIPVDPEASPEPSLGPIPEEAPALEALDPLPRPSGPEAEEPIDPSCVDRCASDPDPKRCTLICLKGQAFEELLERARPGSEAADSENQGENEDEEEAPDADLAPGGGGGGEPSEEALDCDPTRIDAAIRDLETKNDEMRQRIQELGTGVEVDRLNASIAQNHAQIAALKDQASRCKNGS